jgi:DNA-binding YbaB/EbfC family protein
VPELRGVPHPRAAAPAREWNDAPHGAFSVYCTERNGEESMTLNIGDMMAKMQELQARMQEAQEGLRAMKRTVEVGGGMVSVVINGRQEVLSIAIERSLFASGDTAMIEDLVVSAVNKAIAESQRIAQEEMGKATSGMLPSIPGLDPSRFGM